MRPVYNFLRIFLSFKFTDKLFRTDSRCFLVDNFAIEHCISLPVFIQRSTDEPDLPLIHQVRPYYSYEFFHYVNDCLIFMICFSYNSVARLPVAQSTHKIEEKVRRLQNCYHDLYNILWSARVSNLVN